MEYRQVAAAAFAPVGAAAVVPETVRTDHPARRVRDAIEPLAMHAVWAPLVHERTEPLGLDFFATYVWGRACVLGEPTGAVVASTFGSFEPTVLAGVYDAARRLVPRDSMVDLVWSATGESLRLTLLGAEDAIGPGADEQAVRDIADRLFLVVDGLDAAGRPLFAAVQALARPDDPFTALWQACLALREHRGDAHLAAHSGAGLDPVEMNLLTELWLGYPLGHYSGTRAWSQERTRLAIAGLEDRGWIADGAITDEGRVARQDLEDLTDDREQSVLDGLGDALDEVVTTLGAWSDRCVAAGRFPVDPRKRAAG